MSLNVNNSGGPTPIGNQAKAQGTNNTAPVTVGYGRDAFAGGVYQETSITKEVRAMSKEQADSAIKVGGWIATAGVVATIAGYVMAAAAGGLTVAGAFPLALIGLGLFGAFWGATKLAKGVAAHLDRTLTTKMKGLEDLTP